VIVDQHGEGGLEGVLAEVPGGTPGQVVIGQVGEVGHWLQPEMARMGQQAGVEMGHSCRSTYHSQIYTGSVTCGNVPWNRACSPAATSLLCHAAQLSWCLATVGLRRAPWFQRVCPNLPAWHYPCFMREIVGIGAQCL
jgi:hypothetical protein